jgi:DNA-binding SARP family transcriptional activator
VRAWRDSAELDLGPGRQRAILALPVVRAHQLVSIDDLIELLWAHDPPGSAVNTIHTYIGAIQRLLDPAPARSGACSSRVSRPRPAGSG